MALQWRQNGRDSVSNHQPNDCLHNSLFRRRSKKTSKLRVTGLCVGNSPGTGEFPAQRASNAENVSILWRHHGLLDAILVQPVSMPLGTCAGHEVALGHACAVVLMLKPYKAMPGGVPLSKDLCLADVYILLSVAMADAYPFLIKHIDTDSEQMIIDTPRT